MNHDPERSPPSSGASQKRNIGPILTLLVLSPVIGEVLSGATRLSYIFVLVPEIMVWGCGALIIRELVRRWHAGWTSTLLLGFGLSIAEEFVIQQTSIAPLPWLGTAPAYGRVWGVNWPYFAFMLVYEAVWIVLVPIQVTELIFSERRRECWLRARGLVIAGAVFLAGSFIAWFLWTQRARPLAFHVPVYHPPLATVLLGLCAIALLGAVAYFIRQAGQRPSPGAPPRPWVLVATALLLGLPWYLLMVLVFAPSPRIPVLLPLAMATTWAAAAYFLVRHWALTAAWQDVHRWALCFGALLVCMTGGFLGASAWPRSDIVAKAVLNVVAVVFLVRLRPRLGSRRHVSTTLTR